MIRILCTALCVAALARSARPGLGHGALFQQLRKHVQDQHGIEMLKSIELFCRHVFLTDDSFAEGELLGWAAAAASRAAALAKSLLHARLLGTAGKIFR